MKWLPKRSKNLVYEKQGFEAGKKLMDRVGELVGEFLAALGQEPCEMVANYGEGGCFPIPRDLVPSQSSMVEK